jgi:hypothetical protein
MQQCLSLLCAVAGNGGYAGPNRYLVVGNGLTRNGLPLYQHVADAMLSKSICPDGKHNFGAVYDLFYQVVPGMVVWQDNKVAVNDIGQRHHLLHKIAHCFIAPVENVAIISSFGIQRLRRMGSCAGFVDPRADSDADGDRREHDDRGADRHACHLPQIFLTRLSATAV